MKKVAYLAMDVHAGHCVLGHMDIDGTFIGNRRFPTAEQHIIEASVVNNWVKNWNETSGEQ